MDFYIVTWLNPSLLQKSEGKKQFLVRGAFDSNDAIAKVRRQLPAAWIGAPGDSTFKMKRLTFNEHDTCDL